MSVVLSFENLKKLFPDYALETQLRPQRYVVEGDEEIFVYAVHGMGQAGHQLFVTASGHVWGQGDDGSPVSHGGPILQMFLDDMGGRDQQGARGMTVTGLFDLRGDEAKFVDPSLALPLFLDNRATAQVIQKATYEIMTLAGLSHIPSEKPFLAECLTALSHTTSEYRLETQREIDAGARLIESCAVHLLPVSALSGLGKDVQKILQARRADGQVSDVVVDPNRPLFRNGMTAPGGGAITYDLASFRKK